MKKTNRTIDEISAYLDGEAADADAAQRLIQQSEEAATAYVAYSKLSAHLKALPEPDVHPAFATRVLARIEEEQAARSPRWVRWFAGATAAAALCLAAALPFALNRDETPGAPTTTATNVSEDAIVNELARRVAEGDATDAVQPEAYTFGDLMATYSAPVAQGDDEILLALGESEWFNELAVEVSAQQGLPEAISQLDDVEATIFRQLLEDYADEGAAL